MLYNKALDLILALNIQGLDVTLTKTTQYNQLTKQIYFVYRVTVWKRKIVNRKTKYYPVLNKQMKRMSDVVILLGAFATSDDWDGIVEKEK